MNRIIFIDKNGFEHEAFFPKFNNGEVATDTVYSDRLYQWDYKKHNDLCQKHFGNQGQYWGSRRPEQIEAFLRDYIDDQTIVLCRIEKHENRATDYPVWRFDFKKG